MDENGKKEFPELLKKRGFQNTLLIMSILIIAGSFFLANSTKDESKLPFLPPVVEINEKQDSPSVEKEENGLIKEIIKNPEVYDMKEIILQGYLKTEIQTSKTGAGIYNYVITDKKGNKIKLTNLKKEQLVLFENPEKEFNIKGEFRGMYEPQIRVKEINKI